MANETEKKVSTSLERHVQAYPPPKYFRLVDAFSKCNEVSKSEVVNTALKNFFDNMPESEIQRIISVSKNRY